MAVADAENRFLFVDVGAYGSEGDASVFFKSDFGQSISQNTIDLPENASIGLENLPFVFVGDDAFPLSDRIMKPYAPKGGLLEDSQKIFNYRLSRARRCVENAFGILTSKFVCLSRTLFCSPTRAQKIVSACCVLHNYFITRARSTYCPPHLVDRYDNEGNLLEGAWRETVRPLTGIQIRAQGGLTQSSKNIREHFKEFVTSEEGSLPWQRQSVFLD